MKEKNGAVLVLGASRGLGKAIALALAETGFAVGVACRRDEDAQEVSAEIAARGGEALPLTVDVASFASVEQASGSFSAWSGTVAGMVNNAGIIEPIARLATTDPEAWGRLIDVNLKGAYYGVRAILPLMPQGGIIVNVSSGAASRPLEGWSAYCASKAALAMLTQSIHHEHGGQGVLAYGFRPGVIDTGMQGAIRASGVNPISRIPRDDLVKPEVPAAAVAWLFKHRPADLSGTELDVRDSSFVERMDKMPVRQPG